MKKIFFIALFAITAHITQAQTLSDILPNYLKLKDALVSADATAAAAASGVLLKCINTVDMKSMPEKDHKTFMALQDKLAFDARHISESKDINHQREHFTSLSSNMVTLAKGAHLSPQPVYEDYCPMKK